MQEEYENIDKEESELAQEFAEDVEITEEVENEYVPESPALPQKVEVVGVRFKPTGKIYYFDPCGYKYYLNTHVLVKTARGVEYATIAIPNTIVNGSEIVPPLRKVMRRTTKHDEERHEANKESERDAMRIFNEKIAEHKLEMKLVDVEYTFDNNRLTFYFTADGRVDFRDLVKDLASVFKTRIELRQIGIRDETKIIGGLGVCGRPFCCSTFLQDFSQVSIKMAKEQNLSLNSAKISGVCGKLMCCLRYEHETYESEQKNTPKVDSVVVTPDGEGVVAEANVLTGVIKVRLLSEQDKSPRVYTRDQLIRTTRVANDLADQAEAPQERAAEPEANTDEQQPDSDGNEQRRQGKKNNFRHRRRPQKQQGQN